MESARSLAKKALEEICRVVDEDQAQNNRDSEFILVSVVSAVYTEYADNKPVVRRDNLDILWYGADPGLMDTRAAQIEAAMRAAGFYTVSLPMDLGYDAGDQYFGTTQEFCLERAVPDGV